MDVLSVFPAAICVLLALGTCVALMRFIPAPLIEERSASIDGLRGYLAFFVFVHHASFWYFFIHTEKWTIPPSYLYAQFGQSSVSLFFMITGFLFFSKILNSSSRPINWWHLLFMRLMRLAPLYFFALAATCIVVAVVSKGTLAEPLLHTLKSLVKWSSFTILGAPDLNGVVRTWQILAGVTWTLPYEWAFYFSLPILALAVNRKPSARFLLGSLCVLAAIGIFWTPTIATSLPFASGILAAYIARFERVRQFARSNLGSGVVAIALITVPIFFGSARDIGALCLLTLAFVLIAAGTSLFGILTSKVSRFFGEPTYSMYLLHGLCLYITFHFVVGIDQARLFSPIEFWAVIAALTPIVIILSRVTFTLIEAPSMLFGQRLVYGRTGIFVPQLLPVSTETGAV